MANQNTEDAIKEQSYQGIVGNALSILDTTYTLAFRYPQLIVHDFLGHKDTNGPGLDFTSQHPAGAIAINGFVLVLGCFRLGYDINQFKNQKKAIPASVYKINKEVKTSWDKAKDFLDGIWNRLGLSSFVYWLLWVGTTLFNPSGGGLLALSGWIVFGIPILIGFVLFPILKALIPKRGNLNPENKNINTIIDEKFHEPKDKQAAKKNIIERLLDYLAKPFNKNKQPLTTSSFKKKYERLTNNKLLKLLSSFVWNWVVFFATAQYIGWISSDLFIFATGMPIAMPAVMAVFGAIVVASTLYAIYKTLQKNKEINKLKGNLASYNNNDKLEDEKFVREKRESQIKNIPHYNKHGFFDNTDSADFSEKARGKFPILRKFWSFINGFMGGIFMARVFLVPSTVLFMPFTLAAISGPGALIILAAFGLAWGVFRMYHEENTRKEKNAKEFLDFGEERKAILKKEKDFYTKLFENPNINNQLSGEKRLNPEEKVSNKDFNDKFMDRATRTTPLLQKL